MRVDILMASDLRLPGGTTASMAEEIRAQAAAGWTTALVHLNSRLARKHDLPVEPRLRRCLDEGLATLVLPSQEVHARLAVLRNATVFEQDPEVAPRMSAERAAMVVNNVAVDAAGVRHFDAAATDAAVTRMLGVRPTWHPIGPAVRDSLADDADRIDLVDEDWLNLLDVDEWAVDRSARLGRGVPVIGRHSRSSAAKWPADRSDLLAAYPADGSVRVRVLGGAVAVRDVLGSVPPSWVVEEFGARDPRDFVADLDFFVYFHRADLVEAYGRTIMEALASGAVAVLPEHFRRSFGDAAVYTTPQGVQEVVRSLWADPDAYRAQAERGRAFVERTHGHPVHVERLTALLGEPSSPPRPVPSRRRRRDRTRVMFVSSNGAGMGHLTRLLAMATRSSERVEPFFFSMSQAVPVVERYGYAWEHCPSRGDLGTSTDEWNALFAERYAEVLRRYGPAAVVFDGTMPYVGMVEVAPAFPDVLHVWSRRGMWREGTTTRYLRRGSVFDLVLEPGELAGSADRGPTAALTDAQRLDPVTLVGPDDVLPRAEARADLGMEPDAPALLVSLGAGNINDITSDLDVVADAAARVAPGWRVHATKAPIARGGGTPRDDVHVLSVYPLARYLRAFDAAVVAAGYNSFHEVVLAGVPAAFVPNTVTITDDQPARARWAEEAGVGLALEDVSASTAEEALRRLTDATRAEAMRDRASALTPGDGAGQGMALVERALEERGVLR